MDPDSGDYLKFSNITKITLLTLVFTACYFYKTRQSEPLIRLSVSKKDTSLALVIKEKIPAKKKKKTIYLTFDDGPNKGTQNVLDIINGEEIPATLFIVGEHVYGSRLQGALYDSILSSPFVEIANHSYTHAFHNHFAHYYSMPDSVVKDFDRSADSLQLGCGIIRTPGRNIWRLKNIRQTDISNSSAAADSLQKNGYTIMGWDLEWFYTDQFRTMQTTEQMANQVDSMFTHNSTQTLGHLVLLAHDQVYNNSIDSASLHRFVTVLKEKGDYDFALVKQYPGINNNSDTLSVFTKK
jgi:peptidoglycan/xylan/chitin deacetylase (PgdA/CDA1 family)